MPTIAMTLINIFWIEMVFEVLATYSNQITNIGLIPRQTKAMDEELYSLIDW